MRSAALALVRDPPGDDRGNITFADNSLTRAQFDVLRMLAEGYRSKQIAAELNIVEGSVSVKVHRAMKRLGARTAIEAVVICMRKGWIK